MAWRSAGGGWLGAVWCAAALSGCAERQRLAFYIGLEIANRTARPVRNAPALPPGPPAPR